jgi:hypothetical protein
MPKDGLAGPYKFDIETINKNFQRIAPGNFTLGYINEKNLFVVKYVGRDDNDLRSCLTQWIGKSLQYTLFKASYTTNSKDAFDNECHIYHNFGGSRHLDNETHPMRPSNTDWQCPRCDFFKLM